MDQRQDAGAGHVTMRRRELIILLGGAAIASPLTSRAQQKAMPVIGFLSSMSPASAAPFVAAFREGLSETGYIEGQNVAIEYRWAEGHYDQLPALAADLVGRKVKLIVAPSIPEVLATKSATSTIPIVFASGVDPVEYGAVASLARPGGNLTGVSFLTIELMPKRLELMAELVPQAKTIGLLVNPNNPNVERVTETVLDAARAKGLQLEIQKAGTVTEIDTAYASLVQLHAGAFVVAADPFFLSRREQLVALAARELAAGTAAVYRSTGSPRPWRRSTTRASICPTCTSRRLEGFSSVSRRRPQELGLLALIRAS